jgi:conjugal transfer mating pair stabilization protein TraG
MYGLFIPKVDVIVRDEVKNTQQVVQNVPFGIGAFASVFSSIQASLAKKFDEYFSMPDDLKFTRSGYAWGLTALDTAPEMVVMDPYLSATIASFLAECTFNEIVAGVKDYNDILTSDDMLSALSTQDTALYSKIYSEAHPGGESKTCKDVYDYIRTALPQHVVNTVSPYFAKKMTGLTGMDSALTSMVLQKLGYAGQYFMNVSLSGQKMLEQAVLFNMFPAALDIYAVEYGNMPGDYASTMASKRAVANWATSAELAKKYIPTIRQILEALVYGLFPLMFLMMLLL